MAISTQTIHDGHRYLVKKFTGDVAETATLVVDVSALSPACTRVRLLEVQYDMLVGVAVELLWDATTDLRIVKMNGHQGKLCFREIGGLPNDAGAGVTGDVNMVVTGTGAYSVIAVFEKSNPNPA